MHNPFSIKFAALGYAALTAYARGGSAVSLEAQAGEAAAGEVVESAERSQALFGEKAALLSQLHQLAIECGVPNWDGEDAEPIETMAVITAEALIKTIPSFLPLPEIAPDPDGQISLDWLPSKSRMFSVSVGRSGRLSYSWLDGADQGYAVARFDYRSFPARVLEALNSTLNNASIGSA